MNRRPSAILLLAALLPASAAAQDADTFDISGSNLDGQGTLQRHDPHLDDKPTWYAGLGLVYANDPLVLIDGDGNETTVVGGQTSARIQAARISFASAPVSESACPRTAWSSLASGCRLSADSVRESASEPRPRGTKSVTKLESAAT